MCTRARTHRKKIQHGSITRLTLPPPTFFLSLLFFAAPSTHSQVIEFCKHHANDPMPEIEKPLKSANMTEVAPEWARSIADRTRCILCTNAPNFFSSYSRVLIFVCVCGATFPCLQDARFCEIDQEMLFECILAANYMDIKSLLDLTCAKVASMIKGKTPEEIRKTFNVRVVLFLHCFCVVRACVCVSWCVFSLPAGVVQLLANLLWTTSLVFLSLPSPRSDRQRLHAGGGGAGARGEQVVRGDVNARGKGAHVYAPACFEGRVDRNDCGWR